MKNLENDNLAQYGTIELNLSEQMEMEGGFLPAIAYGVCWGLMVGIDLYLLGRAQK